MFDWNFDRHFIIVLVASLAMVSVAVAAQDKWSHTIVIPSQQAVASVPVAGLHTTVSWLTKPMAIDGKLNDWMANDIQPVSLAGPGHIQWTSGESGAPKIGATFYLARDAKGLYLAVMAGGTKAPVTNRIDVSFDTRDNDAVKTGWRDVGARYDGDDNHFVFTLSGNDGKVSVKQTNGRLHLDKAIVATIQAHATTQDGTRVLEAFFPWAAMAPYDPVSYKPMKFDTAIYVASGSHKAVVAWTAGLAGVYDAGHFGQITFNMPPVGSLQTELWARVDKTRYYDTHIPVQATIYNHGKDGVQATLTVTPTTKSGKTAPSQQVKLKLKHGENHQEVRFDSEKIGAGDWSFDLHLDTPGSKALTMVANAPTAANTVKIETVAEFKPMQDKLAAHTKTLSQQYDKIKASGADTTYSLAYMTLYKMFAKRCADDLKGGHTTWARANFQRLDALYPGIEAYNKAVIADPAKAWKVPARFVSSKLKLKDGYYWAHGQPVFLWGPDMFWYVHKDLATVRDLGFNTQGLSENGFFTGSEAARQYFKNSEDWGIPVNAVVGYTSAGQDLAKKHPEVRNNFPNNFMPVIIQNPIVKKDQAAYYAKRIATMKDFPAILTYTVSNEPAYQNFSDETLHDYINDYLKPKYKTIAKLNDAWGTAYKSFDDAQFSVKHAKNLLPSYDFQVFRDQLLSDHFGYLKKLVHDLDPTRAIGVKFMAMSLRSFNMEAMAGQMDFNDFDGNSGPRDIMFLDFSRSLWPNKSLVNTEVHMGWYGGIPMVESTPWRFALHGLAGAAWWCWHTAPWVADSLSNANSMYALTKAGLDVQRLFYPYIYGLNHHTSPIATLYPTSIIHHTNSIRYDEAPPQYHMGIQPFYVTENRIAEGELARHKLLLAGVSDYITDKTYDAIRHWVSQGGHLIVRKDGMAHNPWGVARDTSKFIRPNAGEPLVDGVNVSSYGKGEVICISACPHDRKAMQAVYHRVLLAAMKRYHLLKPVRLAPLKDAKIAADGNFGVSDWRAGQVNGAWVILALPNLQGDTTCRLITPGPVKSVINLVNGKKMNPDSLELGHTPALLRIELTKSE